MEPEDLSQWGLHAFALGARSTPHDVVGMDGNGVLLNALRYWSTAEDLRRRGFTAVESRLRLFELYRLVHRDGDRFKVSFPVIGGDATGRVRSRSGEMARELAARTGDTVAAMAEELREDGFPNHVYPVVFGYAVDGLLWDGLRREGAVPDTGLSVERPLWNGAFWAVYPPREGAAGVNEEHREGRTLVIVWTRETVPAVRESMASGEIRRWREGGELPVPAIGPSHRLHGLAVELCAPIAQALSEEPVLDGLGDLDHREWTLVLAHELVWDLMEAWTDEGLIEPWRPDGGISQLVERIDGE
ncbi:hypothetical protein [Salininema proteolyticum]|uniref:Uncharacterized protein n=1 Tax=Salininema proteolyticum TaxID=1607685 RepID=A0ABV8TXH5_9ACTN